MAEWNFDISQAPRGRNVTRTQPGKNGDVSVSAFQPDPVILATSCGQVIKSRLLPAGKERDADRWEGLATGEQPLAWQIWPAHPHAAVEAA